MKSGVRIGIAIACCLVLIIGVWIATSSKRNIQSTVAVAPPPNAPTPNGVREIPAGEPRPALNPPPSSSRRTEVKQTSAQRSAGPTTSPPIASTPAPSPASEPPTGNPPTSPSSFVSPPVPQETADALIDLNKVSLMVRDYRSLMGENPVGTNAEIMKAIMGANPKGAKLGPPEGQSLNSNGELVDRWGTPYLFHQLSGTRMEIWSAGPDRKIGTSDDIIQR